jgi:hypothetical protein
VHDSTTAPVRACFRCRPLEPSACDYEWTTCRPCCFNLLTELIGDELISHGPLLEEFAPDHGTNDEKMGL